MDGMIAAWYFFVIVYSFGGANPATQIGPFETQEQCEDVAKKMRHTNVKVSPCWESSRRRLPK